MKKTILWIATLIMLATLGVTAVACDDGGIKVTDPKPGAVIVDAETLDLVVGDEKKLNVTYTEIKGATLEFTSDNPGTATVNADGIITAVKPGEAKITATYGKGKASCKVSVTLGGYTPRLSLLGGNEESLTLTATDSYAFVPEIKLGDKTFTGAEDVVCTYVSSKTDVADFDETNKNKLIAKKKGTTSVTIEASWRGFTASDNESLRLTIDVNIIPSAVFKVNNADITGLDLSVVGSVAGFEGEFENEIDFVPSVEIDGAAGDNITVNFSDTTVVNYNETTHKLTAAKCGVTEMWLSTEYDGETITDAKVTVTVSRPTVTVSETVRNFSAVWGGYKDAANNYAVKKLAEINANITDTITDATQNFQDGTTRKLTVDDGSVFGLKLDSESVTRVSLTLGTATALYKFVSVEAYGDVLTKKEDVEKLNWFYLSEDLTGYFAVMNDIDMEGYDFAVDKALNGNQCWGGFSASDYAFKGVFDGLGHKIYNWKNTTRTGGSYHTSGIGLFGYVGNNAVVKNVALIATRSDSGRVLAACVGDNVTLDNVYLEVTEACANPMGAVASGIGAGFKMRNSVVNINSTAAYKDDTNLRGLLIGGYGSNWKTTGSNAPAFSSVYVYGGKHPIAKGWDTLNNANSTRLAYAENETDSTWESVDKQVRYAGVKRYDDTASMTKDAYNNDFSSFNRDYWGIENGIPVFGGDTEEYLAFIGGRAVVNGAEFEAEQNTPYTVEVRGFGAVDCNIETSNTSAVSITDNVFTLSGTGVRATITVKVGSGTIAQITVVTARATQTIDTEIEYFSAMKGGVLDAGNDWAFKSLISYLPAGSTVTDARQISGNDETALVVSGDKITGVTTDSKSVTSIVLAIGTADTVYRFTNVKAYTDILTSKEDMYKFNRLVNKSPLEGYFILVKDIDMEGYNFGTATGAGDMANSGLGAEGNISTNYFSGTFDGRGHTVSGWSDTTGHSKAVGFFGAIFDGSIVKNLALIATKSDQGAILSSGVGSGVTLENLYLKIAETVTVNPRGALGRCLGGVPVKINNIVIDMPVSVSWSGTALGNIFGSFVGGNQGNWYNAQTIAKISNVYVIAEYPIAIGYNNHGMGYAENETEDTWEYTASKHRIGGVKRYDTAAAFGAAINDLSSFDNGMWHVENGTLVWGAGENIYTVRIGTDIVNDGGKFSAEDGQSYTVSVRGFDETEFTLEGGTGLSVSGSTFTFTGSEPATLTVKVGTNTVAIVTVQKKLAEVRQDTVEYFSAKKGQSYKKEGNTYVAKSLYELAGLEASSVKSVLQKTATGEVALGYDAVSGKISNLTLTENSSTTVTSTTIILVTDEARYVFPVYAYTDVIAEADDVKQFNWFDLSEDIVGYFVTVNDIDMGDYNFTVSGKSLAGEQGWGKFDAGTVGFKGTFDGLGHKIYNWKNTGNHTNGVGLFGYLGDKAVVKNVALIATTTGTGRVLACGVGSNVKVSDVYLEAGAVTFAPMGAVAGILNGTFEMKNSVINMNTAYVYDGTNNRGLLAVGYGSNWRTAPKLSDVYAYGGKLPIASDAGSFAYGDNETASSFNGTGSYKIAYHGIKRYDTADQFAADVLNNDFTSFETCGYWGIENGVPVFGSSSKSAYALVDGAVINGGEVTTLANKAHTVSLLKFAPITEFTLSTSDDTAVTVDDIAKTFTLIDANKTATVTATAGSDTVNFTVKFGREAVTVTEDADFSVFDGKIVSKKNADWFGSADYTVESATLGGTALTVESGKITGISSDYARVKSVSIDGATEARNIAPANVNRLSGDLVITTDSHVVTFKNAYAYDGVIINGEQFKKIFDIDTAGKVIDGFYVLGGNIDMTGISLDHASLDTTNLWRFQYDNVQDSTGFHGIFDGRGYTISNFVAKEGGLFGKFYYGAQNSSFNNDDYQKSPYFQTAVVRNVAVTDVDVSAGPVFAKTVNSFYSHAANLGYLSRIENIYVKYAASCTACRGLITYFRPSVAIKGAVIDASALPNTVVNSYTNKSHPLLAGCDATNSDNFLGNAIIFGGNAGFLVGQINNGNNISASGATVNEVKDGGRNIAKWLEWGIRDTYIIYSGSLKLAQSGNTYEQVASMQYGGNFSNFLARNKAPTTLSSLTTAPGTDEESNAAATNVYLDSRNFVMMVFKSVYQYDTAAALTADTTNFNASAFPSQYWTIGGGNVAWKTAA